MELAPSNSTIGAGLAPISNPITKHYHPHPHRALSMVLAPSETTMGAGLAALMASRITPRVVG